MENFVGTSGPYNMDEAKAALLKAPVPVIDIVGEVNSKMFSYVRGAIMYLRSRGNPEVHVTITSPGGDVDAGLDIYDLFRLYEGKKIMTVHDKAASMGAMILQAGDVRQCALHAHVLIHHISRGNVTLDLLRSKKKLAEMIQSMEQSQRRLYAILSDRTGKTVPEIRRECAKDQFMDAEEARHFGLIDEIV